MTRIAVRRLPRILAPLLFSALLPAIVHAESVDELLLRARHKQLVAGDLVAAEQLYKQALSDRSLDAAAQARIRVRLASCLVRRGKLDIAEPYLEERLYAVPGVSAAVQRLARKLRDQVRRRRVRPEPAPVPDGVEQRRARFDQYMAEARRAMDRGEDASAYLRALMAQELFPESAGAQGLVAELETRWSGAGRFLADPARFVRNWTKTRIAQVAARAEKLFREGVARDGKRAINLAEGRLRDAIAVIDACESSGASDRLSSLRQRIVLYWREMRARHGRGLPDIPAVRHHSAPTADYLRALQRLLDMVSSPDREYRLLPVIAPRSGPPLGWHRKPEGFLLLRSAPSRWTLAAFAHEYLRRHVEPRTWSKPDNYLETAGGMLVARNHPRVLDKLEAELRRLEKPNKTRLRARVLVVSVTDAAAAAFLKRFGPFRRFDRGGSPALVRAIPKNYSLDYLASFLRGEGATVHPGRDAFDVPVTNGAAQTFFLAKSLRTARGYESATEGEYGILLDVFPYHDTDATAFLMRVSARAPAPPLKTADGPLLPRFLEQTTEFALEVPTGGILAVVGARDPFADARGASGTTIVLWSTADDDDGGNNTDATAGPAGAEVSVRALLLGQRDAPGPRLDPGRGFVRRDSSTVLRQRARFLDRLVKQVLGDKAEIDVEEATLRIPPEQREAAADLVARMQREGEAAYVVTVRARAVKSSVLQRWMTREGLKRFPFGEGNLALADPPAPELVRGDLESDVFAPEARISVRGLQAAHVLSALTRTVEAADGGAATVTEGLRITMRPYTWRDRLVVELDLQTSARDGGKVAGTRVRGRVDLGDWRRPKTVILAGIPHPTASRPDRLTEIVISLALRRIP